MTVNFENKRFELNAFVTIWYVLAMLLPDLLGFALRDWRAAVVGAVGGGIMILLSLRLAGTGVAAGAERG